MQSTEAYNDNKNTCITWNNAWENYKLIFFNTTHTHSHLQHKITQKKKGKKRKKQKSVIKKAYCY